MPVQAMMLLDDLGYYFDWVARFTKVEPNNRMVGLWKSMPFIPWSLPLRDSSIWAHREGGHEQNSVGQVSILLPI